MKLWSLQTPDFSLTTGKVDHDLSWHFQNIPGVPGASRRLWKLIGIPNGQVIWCLTSRDDVVKTGVHLVLWDLEVPDSEIIAFIDDIAWIRIIGEKCCLPRKTWLQWRQRAIEQYGSETDKVDAYVDARRREFRNQKPPKGDWWKSLLLSSSEGASVSAIIRHPVPQSWVVEKREWQCEDAKTRGKC